jgi:hypoxanthine phosphoribosyltransferase
MIQLHDKQFVPFISAKEIEFAITKWYNKWRRFYRWNTCIYRVLNGFYGVSDFMKNIKTLWSKFIKMASYEGTSSTNEVNN